MAFIRLTTLVLLLAARSADSGRVPSRWDPRSSRAEVEFVALAKPGNLKILGRLPEEARGAANWRFQLKGRELSTLALVLSRTVLPPGADGPEFEGEGIRLRGTLTLHGVSRPLDGTLALKRAGTDFRAELTLRVRLKEFRIAAPSFMGVTVEDEVLVTARLQGFAPKP